MQWLLVPNGESSKVLSKLFLDKGVYLMINASINADVRKNGTVAKVDRQALALPVERPEHTQNCWRTVEADYVLFEPEIHEVKHEKVTHRRRIL